MRAIVEVEIACGAVYCMDCCYKDTVQTGFCVLFQTFCASYDFGPIRCEQCRELDSQERTHD